jgi:hypothetical protein
MGSPFVRNEDQATSSAGSSHQRSPQPGYGNPAPTLWRRAHGRADGSSFEWHAHVGVGPLKPLQVLDRYENGTASVSGRLLSRWQLFKQADESIVRSAAGRAALESVFAPASLLPSRGCSWRAESDRHIIASRDIQPEHIEVRMRIADDGRLLNVVAQRWGEPMIAKPDQAVADIDDLNPVHRRWARLHRRWTVRAVAADRAHAAA